MRYLLLTGLLTLLLACGDTAAETEKTPVRSTETPAPVVAPALPAAGAADRTYVPGQRIGMITATTTPDELVEIYGRENVRADSVALGKGFFVNSYTIFPETTSEINLVYPNEQMRVNDSQVTIDLGSTDWKSAQNSVGIGTTLEELQNANGHNFTFMGFDWDYGGVVTDWQGGALTDHRLRLGYDFANREEVDLHHLLVGNQKVVTNNPYLKDVDVKVIQVIVRLPAAAQ